jgi:hypothetical protein
VAIPKLALGRKTLIVLLTIQWFPVMQVVVGLFSAVQLLVIKVQLVLLTNLAMV